MCACVCVCVVRMLKIYSQQLSCIQYQIINCSHQLYIAFSEVILSTNESLHDFTYISYFLLSAAPGNNHSILCFYEIRLLFLYLLLIAHISDPIQWEIVRVDIHIYELKAFSYSPMSIMLPLFAINGLYYVEIKFSLDWTFEMNGWWILSKAFSASIGMIV